MAKSSIEWTETTWNPSTGCTKISEGCKNCYAERMALRLQSMGIDKYESGFGLKLHPDILNEPLTWRTPRTVFVNSMSDLFHEDIPFEFIQRVFGIMNRCQQHTFQVLTKRADVLFEYNDRLTWTKNIWMGVTVENSKHVNRIESLKYCSANVKFLSVEPLLGKLPYLNLQGIDWVIVGGESGPGARLVKEEWVVDIMNMCQGQHTPFFFKQWGGVNKKKTGRMLKGKVWDEKPEIFA